MVEIKWVLPLVGFIKLNFDGSYQHVYEAVGIGIIARDDQGTFLLAICMPIISSSAFMAECCALRMALIITKILNIPNVWYETNSQALMLATQKLDSTITYEAPKILLDIRALMSTLHAYNFDWTYREGIEVANLLAFTGTKQALINNFPLGVRSIKSNYPEHLLHQMPDELSYWVTPLLMP